MSLIRESLKKVQEDDQNNKTTATLISGPPANAAKKVSSSMVILIGVGVLLIAGAAYFLYGPRPSKPVVPAASAPPPVTVAKGPSPSIPAAPTKPGAGPSLPTIQAPPSRPAATPTLKGSAPVVGSLSGPAGPLQTPGEASREPLKEKRVESSVIGPGSVPSQKAGRGKESVSDLVVQLKEKTGPGSKAKASSREVPGATEKGAGELRDLAGGQEALKQSYQQAYTWQQEGKTNQALSRYREILAQDPNNPYVLTNLGLIYQQNGNLKEAISYYEKAMESDPRFAPAAQNLGVAWLKAGNSEEAARWLERSLALQPDNPNALVNLGIMHKKRGNREMARQFFKKAWALNNRIPEVSYNLARLEEEAGNIPEAWKYYQQFIRMRNDPNDPLVQEVQRHVQDWRVSETVQR
jgi:Tfp pilus assembly protein PilF